MGHWDCTWGLRNTVQASFSGLSFFYRLFVHNYTRRLKNSEKWGSIHHVCGHEVDIEEKIRLSIGFLASQDEQFKPHIYVWSLNQSGAFHMNDVVHWLGPPSPLYVYLASTRHDKGSVSFPVVHHSSASLYYCECKWKVKTRLTMCLLHMRHPA